MLFRMIASVSLFTLLGLVGIANAKSIRELPNIANATELVNAPRNVVLPEHPASR